MNTLVIPKLSLLCLITTETFSSSLWVLGTAHLTIPLTTQPYKILCLLHMVSQDFNTTWTIFLFVFVNISVWHFSFKSIEFYLICMYANILQAFLYFSLLFFGVFFLWFNLSTVRVFVCVCLCVFNRSCFLYKFKSSFPSPRSWRQSPIFFLVFSKSCRVQCFIF